MKATHQATGHLDRNGEMIHRHDTVQVVRRPHYIQEDYSTLPTREARVLWVGKAWLLWYGGRETEPLNSYSCKELRRAQNACDNKCDNRV